MWQIFHFMQWLVILTFMATDSSAMKNIPTSNMNGEYLISNPNAASGKSFSASYADYPDVEYFDAYSPPISTK